MTAPLAEARFVKASPFCRYVADGKVAAVGERLQPSSTFGSHAIHAVATSRRCAFGAVVTCHAAQSHKTRRICHQEPGNAHHGADSKVNFA